MSNNLHASTAGASAPGNDEGPAVASSGPLGKPNGQPDSGGIAQADQAGIRAKIEQKDKHFANLRAELARRGFALHVVDAANGASHYLIERRDRSRELAAVAGVGGFLCSVGGTK